LDYCFYSTQQFACKASVSVRTLRYYDQVGLLSPSRRTEAGYRLYTDEDLSCLQQILALKFLGFSLDEIKQYLWIGPPALQEALALQKVMMQEKRVQLDTIIQAIEKTERVIQAGQQSWDAIVSVIQVIQMSQTSDWQDKYFTPEQRQKMQEISEKSYTPEQHQKLAARGEWTEADQKVADQKWGAAISELKSLMAAGKDPGSPEAQALAKQWQGLIYSFTQGDPDIATGLNQWWTNFQQLPDEEKPFTFFNSPEEGAYIQKALEIYKQQHP